MKDQPYGETSPHVSDEIRKTTWYMCACRCGINVHMKDGQVAYIEGNRDHPVNQGVLCAKGSAGIMQVNAPSRLRAPLKRVGPRGSGEFEEITWDEALDIAVGWLKPVREENPEKLAFFTGRDQSQPLPVFGHKITEPPIMRPMAGFAALIWQRLGFTPWAGRFGSLVNQIGTTRSSLCSLESQKIMTAIPLRWASARSKPAVQK